MPRAEMLLLTSQLMVVVQPTAAVAWVPSTPTIAVSMYCTAVYISCSNIVGQASVKMTGSIFHCRDLRITHLIKHINMG